MNDKINIDKIDEKKDENSKDGKDDQNQGKIVGSYINYEVPNNKSKKSDESFDDKSNYQVDVI